MAIHNEGNPTDPGCRDLGSLENVLQRVNLLKWDLTKETPRERAKAELQGIYASNEWYSARYEAAQALGVPQDQLKIELGDWIEQLGSDLDVGEHVPNPGQPAGSATMSGRPLTSWVPNLQTQKKARVDLEHLYGALFCKSEAGVYTFKEERRLVGRTLGYSNIGLLARDHPRATENISLAAIILGVGAVAIGLVLYYTQ